MFTPSNFQELQQKVWNTIVKKGCEETSTALETFLKMPISMSGMVKGFIPVPKIPFMAGDPNQIVTGARMIFSGDIAGHMLLILPSKSWEACKELLLVQTRQAASRELEISAFAELANITCSYFIANLANVSNFAVPFSPPEVVNDMTATVLEDTLMALSLETNELLTIETILHGGQKDIKGYLFFIPSADSATKIIQRFLKATLSG